MHLQIPRKSRVMPLSLSQEINIHDSCLEETMGVDSGMSEQDRRALNLTEAPCTSDLALNLFIARVNVIEFLT
jgi:hypothetical protein